MIGLFFEVQTKLGHRQQYLDLAASLKPDLEAIAGCLYIDRFRSLTRENLLLSHQIWQDEGALTAWRTHARHHDVQTIGRAKVFSDYRIRVAQLIHEAKPGQPVWQPERRTPYNDPARRKPTYLLAAESKHATLPAETEWRREAFASVYREEHFAHLFDLPDEQAGVAFGPRLFADPTVQYFRVFEVMRDYGMFERGEAPQYHPPIAPRSQ
jgi:heme-degrading monooxygenase HmoA